MIFILTFSLASGFSFKSERPLRSAAQVNLQLEVGVSVKRKWGSGGKWFHRNPRFSRSASAVLK
jgi:hypothetical protein